MFSNTGIQIRKMTAVILAIMSVFMMMPARAETVTAETIFGEVKNDTYENAFLGLGCTLEGWRYYSDAELEEVNQRTKDALADELAEMIDRNIGIMMAERTDGMQNVNIQLQNVKNYVSVYDQVGLEYVATASLNQYKSTLESAGFTDVQLSTGEYSIGDRTYTSIYGNYKLQGVRMYFRQLWDLRDIYLVIITVTTIREDTADEVFSKFCTLD